MQTRRWGWIRRRALGGGALPEASSVDHLTQIRLGDFRITIERVRLAKRNITYICDDFHEASAQSTVVAWDRTHQMLLASLDKGNSWHVIAAHREIGFTPEAGMLLLDGTLILRSVDGDQAYRSPSGQILGRTRFGAFPWHGSWGIDEDGDRTVLFAEYQIAQDRARPVVGVWRAVPPYMRWELVLCRAVGKSPPDGEVRHFHVCQFIPALGRWIVASGDVGAHNRVWTSSDGGRQWTEQSVRLDGEPASVRVKDPRRLIRLTSMCWTGSKLLWGTDDTLGVGRSAAVTAGPQALFGRLSIGHTLSVECVRNVVSIDPSNYLFLTECKKDLTGPDVLLVDADGNAVDRWKAPNPSAKRCPFTRSLGSRRFRDGVALSPHLNRVMVRGGGGLIRWRIEGK